MITLNSIRRTIHTGETWKKFTLLIISVLIAPHTFYAKIPSIRLNTIANYCFFLYSKTTHLYVDEYCLLDKCKKLSFCIRMSVIVIHTGFPYNLLYLIDDLS